MDGDRRTTFHLKKLGAKTLSIKRSDFDTRRGKLRVND
jgi:hypothetical protein